MSGENKRRERVSLKGPFYVGPLSHDFTPEEAKAMLSLLDAPLGEPYEPNDDALPEKYRKDKDAGSP
jgi:hypothetical protein